MRAWWNKSNDDFDGWKWIANKRPDPSSPPGEMHPRGNPGYRLCEGKPRNAGLLQHFSIFLDKMFSCLQVGGTFYVNKCIKEKVQCIRNCLSREQVYLRKGKFQKLHKTHRQIDLINCWTAYLLLHLKWHLKTKPIKTSSYITLLPWKKIIIQQCESRREATSHV